MDHFGIGAAVTGAARIYFQSARRTGRTTSLVDSLKDGDRVVFQSQREGQRVKSLCKERGVNIEIVISDPRHPEGLFSRGTAGSDARLVFDHSWVEDYYLNTLTRASDEIDRLQTQLSGYSEPHRETKRRAEELAKWRF